MEKNPLSPDILFHIGPIGIDRAVATTWLIIAILWAIAAAGMRNRNTQAGTLQTVLEIVVDTMARQIEDIMQRDPWPYMPLLGTLFIFLSFANLTAVMPGLTPPTGHVETPATLAVIVFFSVHFYGIRSRGLKTYLQRYTQPNVLLLPLNILSELTRTFSLMVRLFGNMMSHEFVIAIVVFLAGLFLPVPFMVLGVLIGLIQAYIFTVLAAVYIGAAVGAVEA